MGALRGRFICGVLAFLAACNVFAEPVGVPVLDPEPAFSPGTTNTVSWSAVADAAGYWVECDTDSSFASPDANSGWTTSTSHTFTGLSHGANYYYRVKARRADEGTTRTWAQSDTLQFETDQMSTVSARRFWDQVCLPKNTLINPGGEAGYLVDGWQNDNWSYGINDWITNTADGHMPTEGTKYLAFTSWGSNAYAGEWVSFKQTLDITGYQQLVFDAELTYSDVWIGMIGGQVRIDGAVKWQKTTPGYFPGETIDLSGYSGVHTIEVGCYATTSDNSWRRQAVNYDNFRLTPSRASYPGTITSPVIAPEPFNRWLAPVVNVAHSTGTVLTLDILPESGDEPIAGFANVQSGAELTTLTAKAIRLRANLDTTNGLYTPCLNDWAISWLDGYTQSEFSSSVSSTQDLVAPTVDIVDVAPDPRKDPVTALQINFSEPVANVGVSDLVLRRDGGANLLSGSESLTSSDATHYTLDVSALAGAQGVYTLELRTADIVDRAGNPLASGASESWQLDTQRPTPTIACAVGASTDSTSIPVTITFDEAVNGFTNRDVVVSNAHILGFSGSGTTYHFWVSPISRGPISISVPENGAQDWVGNGNVAAVPFGFSFTGRAVIPALVDMATGDEDMIVYGMDANDQIGSVPGDFNGDGIEDLFVVAFDADGPANARYGCGEGYIYFGSLTTSRTLDTAGLVGRAPDVTIYGAATWDGLGSSVTVSDVNGDGREDLIVGAYQADGPAGVDAGAAYIFFNKSVWPSVIDLAAQQYDVVINAPTADNVLTRWAGAVKAADVTGDGINDLIFGSYLDGGYAGQVYILYGKTTWGKTVNLATERNVTIVGGEYGAVNRGWLTSWDALKIGDFNGDGIKDLSMGAAKGWGPGDTRSECGRCYLLLGTNNWPSFIDLSTSSSMTVYGAYSGERLTMSGRCDLTDLDNDGYDDLLLGTTALDQNGPPYRRGAVYVIYGRPSGIPAVVDLAAGQANATINGIDNGDYMVYYGTPDLNGDGFKDLVLSAPYGDGPGNSRPACGDTYVFFGKGTRLSGTVNLSSAPYDLVFYGPLSNAPMSYPSFADWNGDGISDIMFQVDYDRPGEGSAGMSAGACFYFKGRKQWSAVIDATLTSPDAAFIGAQGNDLFGGTTAVDLNGDGSKDMIFCAPWGDGPANGRTDAGELYVFLTPEPGAPSIEEEPAWTPGTTNTLNWVARPKDGGYRLQCATDEAFGSVVASGDVSSGTCAFTFSGLSDGQSYWYRVQALRQDGTPSEIWSEATSSTQDALVPTVGVLINQDAVYTSSTAVTLGLTSNDAGSNPSGVEAVRVNDGTGWGAWQSFAPTLSWTIPSGSSSATIQVQARDRAGNLSEVASDSIVVDATVPTASAFTPVTRVGGTIPVTVNYSDAQSGIAQATLYVREPGQSWRVVGAAAPTGTIMQFTPTSAVSGRYFFRVVASDVAGNVSPVPSGTALLGSDRSVAYNPVVNGVFTDTVVAGSSYTGYFPMVEGGARVQISILGNYITSGGTITVTRHLNDTNSAGLRPEQLINEHWTITAANGFSFVGAATVTFRYDEASLGGIPESSLDVLYRVQGSSVLNALMAPQITISTAGNTFQASLSGFSDWYIGTTQFMSSVADWSMY